MERNTMKLASALLLSFAAVIYAADQSTQTAKPEAPAANQPAESTLPPADSHSQVVKKLGSVTWDPDAHKLLWTVQKGSVVNGEFVPSSEDQYEISPDEATMGRADEKRGFDGEEAEGLHQLLDILSLYCAESVAWWDEGLGTPVQSTPSKSGSPAAQKPVKIHQPQTKPAPLPRTLPGTSVAELQRGQ
jgi:hypothetical protein